jgi:hypothetical protein
MKYSNTVNKMRFDLQARFTKGLKQRIRDLDLIDTGATLRQTESRVIINDDGVDFDVDSTDYFKYLDGNYNIVDATLASREISDLMSELIGQIMLDELMEDEGGSEDFGGMY